MLNNLFSFLNGLQDVQSLYKVVDQYKTIAISDVAEGEYAFLSALLYEHKKRPICLICNTDIKAAKLAKSIENLYIPCVYIPPRDKQFSRIAQSHETLWDRISALDRVVNESNVVVCCSIETACDFQAPPEVFKQKRLKFELGDCLDPQVCVDKLIQMGYERVDMVEGKGQCALRGDILDVFSPNHYSAARIEFFDEEIDNIRIFDCISQRSIKNVDDYDVCIASEGVFWCNTSAVQKLIKTLQNVGISDDVEQENALHTKNLLLRELEVLLQGYAMPHYATMIGQLYEKQYSIFNFLTNPLVLLVEPNFLQEKQNLSVQEYATSLTSAMLNGFAFEFQNHAMQTYDEFIASIADLNKITLSGFTRGMGKLVPEHILSLKSTALTPYNSNIKLFIDDVRKYGAEGFSIFIFAGNDIRLKRLQNTLQAIEKIDMSHITLLSESLETGFISPSYKLMVVADGDIYGTSYAKLKKKFKDAEKIASYTELNQGDYVVHENYGVGIYRGIVNIEQDKVSQDYLLIEYASGDKLYVPTEQFDRVQKFASAEGASPKVNKLGGNEWQRKKSKIKSKLKELAFNLIKLYAERSQNNGFAFSKDNPWQMQFEDFFPYELTLDQDKCIKEIYADMESNRAMDRLLCGDVGYGKTELAMRAAFKAVCDSKQVAILAPTTILAQQHYQTVAKRFKHFPVKFDMLSRFKTAKEQKQTIAELAEGKVDILVGTHRLLAKDVKFKNLGLLIVDEEQRFGVGHKEVIKNLKQNIDVLTLSATPIPRTLYMSMIGVRDISVIETPPEDRLPVKTYVTEYDDATIKSAIQRELKRGGQIYFLYNHVNNIENMANHLRGLVPECKIAIGHGQMPERQLEQTMMAFYSGAYDLLLCTTIIENGLDVPEANTIIIYDADKFGLSQLYQLRGRVGRSYRQGYAYFMVKPSLALSEIAQKRLLAIREFTEFGAGYRIAMRDLEIRGAGNIFGPEQSGHLTEIGFDMYIKLIEQTLNDVQGKGQVQDVDTRINLPLSAFLPEKYVPSEKERIEIYKRIAMIKDVESRMDIEEELTDRFGNLPDEVLNLCLIAHLRAFTRQLGVTLVNLVNGFLFFQLNTESLQDPTLLINAISLFDNRFVFSNVKPYGIRFISSKKDLVAIIKEVLPILANICAYVSENTANKENDDQSETIKETNYDHSSRSESI